MVSTLKNGGHLRCSKEWDQDGGGATLTYIATLGVAIEHLITDNGSVKSTNV
jgi:hypothetical protein